MTSYKKLLIIFLIPFTLAINLMWIGDYFFQINCTSYTEINGDSVCFEFHDKSALIRTGFRLLIGGLFFLSVVLPPLITWREYQNQKASRKLKSKVLIVNGNN